MKEPLYEKAEKRTIKDTKEERDRHFGRVKSYAGTASSLTVSWNLNTEAMQDGICMIKIGDQTAYIDKEQLLKFLRWV